METLHDDGENAEIAEKRAFEIDKGTITSITDSFLHDIRSLQHAQKETSKVLSKNIADRSKIVAEFLEKLSSKKIDGESEITTIPANKVEKLLQIVKDLSASGSSLPLSHRGLFLVLISKWDTYFANLLRWVYKTKPEIIDNSLRAITFSELKKIDSIEAARAKIIADEISVVLRDSHGDQFAYLEKKIGATLTKMDIWPTFIEISQRRNLIAHTDGKISPQYLEVCRTHGVKIPETATLDSKLEAPPAYFREACDCLAEIGFKLSQVLSRKLTPDENSKAESHLIDKTFEMIKDEQYALAIRILDFFLSSPMKFNDARGRSICIINLALAHKWSGEDTKCQEIVTREDWSASSADLLLAVAVLKNDDGTTIDLMKRIGTSKEITKESYQSWPLFKNLRKTEIFNKTYKEIFGSGMEIGEILSDVTTKFTLPEVDVPSTLSKSTIAEKKTTKTDKMESKAGKSSKRKRVQGVKAQQA